MTQSTPPTLAPGWAGGPGTERYRDRHASAFAGDFYRPLAEDLAASSIGVGTYLGECDDADDARSAVEHRFCELIDAALETVHAAARFAADARARGPDAIAQARLRIAAWSRELDDLRAQLERQVVGPVHGC
jgi:hypothetical protein